MRCSLCSHPKRAAIEGAAKASSIAYAAEKFGVSENALVRHIASHPHAPTTKVAKAPRDLRRPTTRVRASSPARKLPPVAVDDDEDAPATSRSPLTPATARANAIRIATTIDGLLTDAGKDKEASYQEKAALARAALSANRQLAQLTGEWGASETAVASSPHFKRLLNAMLEALRGDVFGEARRAVLDALEREERGGKATEQVAA